MMFTFPARKIAVKYTRSVLQNIFVVKYVTCSLLALYIRVKKTVEIVFRKKIVKLHSSKRTR
jgi:hypothetical protein